MPTRIQTCLQSDTIALQTRETERTEAAALLERRMAAMEAVLAARRKVLAEPAKPEAARGPGADLRFGVRHVCCRMRSSLLRECMWPTLARALCCRSKHAEPLGVT